MSDLFRPRLPKPMPAGNYHAQIFELNREIDLTYKELGTFLEALSRVQPRTIRLQLMTTAIAEVVEREQRLDFIRRSLLNDICESII